MEQPGEISMDFQSEGSGKNGAVFLKRMFFSIVY
jgi:hypothetical protein